ncbi:hypothetical protein ACWGLC_12730 [Dietzia sp. NPDC055877]
MAEGAIRVGTENQGELVLQLRAEGLAGGAIAASRGMSRKSVAAVLEAANETEASWDDVAKLADEQLCARLFPGRGERGSVFAQPDWEQVHREMARAGVTLKLLHSEYTDRCAASPAAMKISGNGRPSRTVSRKALPGDAEMPDLGSVHRFVGR